LHGLSLPTNNHRKYNDVSNWKWTKILDTFGGDMEGQHGSYLVRTRSELDQLLKQPAFGAADKIQLVEIVMPAEDAPQALERQAELTGKGNSY